MKQSKHYYLIYLSRCNENITEQEILDILLKSFRNNEKNDITSILIHRQGQFLQVMEGDKNAVSEIYNRIKTDHRHFDLQIIDEDFKTERFSDEFIGIRYSSSLSSRTFKHWFYEGFNPKVLSKYKTLTHFFLRMMGKNKPEDIQAREYEHYRLLG